MFQDPLLENPFRWKIIVHPKPRGLWRPMLELSWWIKWTNPNPLNINMSIGSMPFSWKDEPNWPEVARCENCSKCQKFNTWKILGCTYYEKPQHGDSDTDKCRIHKFLNGTNRQLTVYLPWRPGKPDYNDIVEWWVKNFFEPIEKEIQRRLEEAYQSEPTEEVVLDSESHRQKREMKKVEKEVVEGSKPTRKIQIA